MKIRYYVTKEAAVLAGKEEFGYGICEIYHADLLEHHLAMLWEQYRAKQSNEPKADFYMDNVFEMTAEITSQVICDLLDQKWEEKRECWEKSVEERMRFMATMTANSRCDPGKCFACNVLSEETRYVGQINISPGDNDGSGAKFVVTHTCNASRDEEKWQLVWHDVPYAEGTCDKDVIDVCKDFVYGYENVKLAIHHASLGVLSRIAHYINDYIEYERDERDNPDYLSGEVIKLALDAWGADEGDYDDDAYLVSCLRQAFSPEVRRSQMEIIVVDEVNSDKNAQEEDEEQEKPDAEQ